MDAEVLVKFKFLNVCNKEDVTKFNSFENIVKNCIKEEGLWGVIEDEYEIISVKEK